MGPIGFPETSVKIYHRSLLNNPEERSHYRLTPDVVVVVLRVTALFYRQCVGRRIFWYPNKVGGGRPRWRTGSFNCVERRRAPGGSSINIAVICPAHSARA